MKPRAQAFRDTSRITLRYAFAFGGAIALVLGLHGIEMLSRLP
jgi:hypothetical protein